MPADNKVLHWIGGEYTTSDNEGVSINPATGESIGTFADGDAGTMQHAIDAAHAAFVGTGWADDHMLRTTALAHMADAFATHRKPLADALVAEIGKLASDADREAGIVGNVLRFAAALAVQTFGRVRDPRPGHQALVLRQPVGVAGIIVPWNAPVALCLRAVAPALAAGCTVVVKLPGVAAQTAGALSQVFASVSELPPGVINVVIESGSAGAQLLVASDLVPAISFTGSSEVGKRIYQAAAAQFKSISLELGGKSPHLVFEDADLEAVIPALARSSTTMAGQFCMAGSRILVSSSIAETVTEQLAARLRSIKVGPGTDPASEIGPLISMANVHRVDAAVDAAIAAGARAVVRGGPPEDTALKNGAFYRPALLAVRETSLDIVQEETFGPVQVLQEFDTEDQAVELANATKFGLSASVWSRDINRLMRVARRLDAGLVSINSWANLSLEFEEGGFKASGVGRLNGVAAIDTFLEYKQIGHSFA
jgi:betaine-aldehyde dehydrogenase